jgi:hypothetical protein
VIADTKAPGQAAPAAYFALNMMRNAEKTMLFLRARAHRVGADCIRNAFGGS